MEENELDQSEAIRKWWQENGTSVFTGVLLGLALLFGWRGWSSYQATQQEMASTLYSQSVASFEQGNVTKARELASQLLSDYNTSVYAIQATLHLARHEVEEKNYDSAHAHLDWIIKQDRTPEFTNTARLRKARLFIAENKLAELKALLATVKGNEGTFKMSYAEIRGDMAVLEGRLDDARTAYNEVLSLSELTEDGLSFEHKDLVEMKLNNLGEPESERVVATPPPAPKIAEIADSIPEALGITPEIQVTTTVEPASETQLTDTIKPLTEAVTNIVDSASKAATEKANSITETVTNIVDSVSGAATTDSITETVTNIVDSASKAAAEKTDSITETVTNIVDSVSGAATTDSITETVTNIVDSASKAAAEKTDSITETVTNIVDSVSKAAAEKKGSITETVTNIVDSASKTLSEALGKSVDPNTGTIPASEISAALDKLAPALSEIAEKLTAPQSSSDTQETTKP
ncbi:tetratricopeptide repeat protein [Candidatus Albibeggiatoa sp. nov. BB20]|uniref:tetratricopeptide repeat protein n=1 Tax=Candidatus Albibeggiatoa sp. nov. BB20 TaxID=3162723 RepID=UPI0033655BF5